MKPVENTGVSASSIRLKPYRLREAAEATGIPKSTLFDAIKRGEVPHTRIGKAIFIPAPFIERVLTGAPRS